MNQESSKKPSESTTAVWRVRFTTRETFHTKEETLKHYEITVRADDEDEVDEKLDDLVIGKLEPVKTETGERWTEFERGSFDREVESVERVDCPSWKEREEAERNSNPSAAELEAAGQLRLFVRNVNSAAEARGKALK